MQTALARQVVLIVSFVYQLISQPSRLYLDLEMSDLLLHHDPLSTYSIFTDTLCTHPISKISPACSGLFMTACSLGFHRYLYYTLYAYLSILCNRILLTGDVIDLITYVQKNKALIGLIFLYCVSTSFPCQACHQQELELLVLGYLQRAPP